MSLTAYPKYESYKDSGVDWIGAVPSSWGVERGKWLFSKMDRPVRAEDDIVTCFRDGVVTLRANRRTEGFTNALKEHGYQGVRKGDLVIHAMDAFAGAVGVSDSDGKSTPVYSACVPRKERSVDPYFYAYYMRHLALSGLLVALAKGIRERSTDFRFNDFADLLLATPHIDEQKAIVSFLDKKCAKIDEAVRIKEEQIKLLRERRQILIQQAVTRGLNPDVPMKDSGIDWIGQIPEHWEVRKVKQIFRLVADAAEKNNAHELLSIYTDIGVRPRKDLEERGNKASTTDGYWMVRKGDFIVNKLLAWMGAIGLSEYDGVTSPAYDILRPRASLNGNFFHRLFRSQSFSSEIKRFSRGIMEMRLRIYFDKLGVLLVPFPPKSEQDEIISFLDKHEQKIESAISIKQNQIIALKEYKTTLINAAVTGKIKITADML